MSRESGLYSNYADEVRVWAKKEIAKFEEEKKDLEKLIKSSLRHLPSMEEEIKKLKEENEELKKEIKKNQQRNLDLMDFRCLCDDMGLSELSAECLNEEIKKLKAVLADRVDRADAAVETLKFMGYKYNAHLRGNGSWEEEEEDDE